jgi:hypothetical protein
VTIITRTDTETKDAYGNKLPSEAAVQALAELQPRSTSEPGDHGDLAESDWIGFFLPADADSLRSSSAIWADGLGQFELVGAPLERRSAFSQTEQYVKVNLKRTAGPEADEGS